MSTARPLTGRRVLLIAIGIFAVVLTPNLLLAWFAVSTFSGLVVDNSYVASQGFDRDRAAQEALGWTFRIEPTGDGTVSVRFADASDRTVFPETLAIVVGRPTTTRADLSLALQPAPGGYVAAADLAPGNWVVMVDASAADGTAYRRRERLVIPANP